MIIETAKFLIEGQSLADIKEFLKNKDKTEKEADEIIKKAFDIILSDSEMNLDMRTAWCIEAYRDIYKKLVETGDYNGAIKAIKEISLLAGVKKKTQKEKKIDEKAAISTLKMKRLSIVRK